ncbi:MAG: peptide deformylase [Oscillospiraceae bacterium]|nr:peptide deformylase [Oscillospiraceae bacterium]
MAVRNIVQRGDLILQKKSRPVEKFDERLGQLIDDMKETLIQADGAGLAAVQVGVLRRVCIVDSLCKENTSAREFLELVNPEIVKEDGQQENEEGCLSVPEERGITRRPAAVQLKAQDRHGNWHIYSGKDIKARAFCHEIDHMNGILFTDRVIRSVHPRNGKQTGRNTQRRR